MLRRDVAHHVGKEIQNFGVFLQLLAPRLIVHIRKVDFDLFAKREQIIGILIVAVKLVYIGNVRQIQCGARVAVKPIDGINRTVNEPFDSLQRQIERIDRAFHTLHQVDGHQPADTLLAAGLCKSHVDSVVAVKLRVFFHFAWQNKVRRRINRQVQKHQLLKNLVVVDGPLQIRQMWTQRDRL